MDTSAHSSNMASDNTDPTKDGDVQLEKVICTNEHGGSGVVMERRDNLFICPECGNIAAASVTYMGTEEMYSNQQKGA